MADINKAWSKSDKEAFSRGMGGGKAAAKPAIPTVEADKSYKITMPDQDAEEKEMVKNTQSANLAAAKNDPGVRDRLNAVASELAKMRARKLSK